jgi:hypothetical protein
MGAMRSIGTRFISRAAMPGQGRYYSCPLGRVHLWEALRYTELNRQTAYCNQPCDNMFQTHVSFLRMQVSEK